MKCQYCGRETEINIPADVVIRGEDMNVVKHIYMPHGNSASLQYYYYHRDEEVERPSLLVVVKAE